MNHWNHNSRGGDGSYFSQDFPPVPRHQLNVARYRCPGRFSTRQYGSVSSSQQWRSTPYWSVQLNESSACRAPMPLLPLPQGPPEHHWTTQRQPWIRPFIVRSSRPLQQESITNHSPVNLIERYDGDRGFGSRFSLSPGKPLPRLSGSPGKPPPPKFTGSPSRSGWKQQAGNVNTESVVCRPSLNHIVPLLPGLQSSRRVGNPLQPINDTVPPTRIVSSELLVTSPTKNATPTAPSIGSNYYNGLHVVPSTRSSLVPSERSSIVSLPATRQISGISSEHNSHNNIASTVVPAQSAQHDDVSQVLETLLAGCSDDLTRTSAVGDVVQTTVRDSIHPVNKENIVSVASNDLLQKSLAKDRFGVSVPAAGVEQTDKDQCCVLSTTDDITLPDEESSQSNVAKIDCSIASTSPPVKHCDRLATSQCALTTAQSFMSGGMGNMWKTLTGDQGMVVGNDQPPSPSVIAIVPTSPTPSSLSDAAFAPTSNCSANNRSSSSTAAYHMPVTASVAARSHCSHQNHMHPSSHHHFLPISSSCIASSHSFSANGIPHVHRHGDCHSRFTTKTGCTAENAIELGSPELVRDGINGDQTCDTPECITIDDGASDAGSSAVSSPEVICLDDVTAVPATSPTSPPILNIASVCSLSTMKLETISPIRLKRGVGNEQAERTSAPSEDHPRPCSVDATPSTSAGEKTEKASTPDLRLSAAKVEVLRQRWQKSAAVLPATTSSPNGSPVLPDPDGSRETSTANVNDQKAIFEEAVRIARLRNLNVQSSDAGPRAAVQNRSSASAATKTPTNDDEVIIISESVEDLTNATECDDPITAESPESLAGSLVQTKSSLQPNLNANDSVKSSSSPPSSEVVDNPVSSATGLDNICQGALPAIKASSPASPVTDGTDAAVQSFTTSRRKSDSLVELGASLLRRMSSVAGSSSPKISAGIFDILQASVAGKSPPSSFHAAVDVDNNSSAEADRDFCPPVTVPVAEPPLSNSGTSPAVLHVNNNVDKSSHYGLDSTISPGSAATPSPPLLTSAYDDANIPVMALDLELADDVRPDDAVPVEDNPLSPILSMERPVFSPLKFDDADLDDDLPSFSVSDVSTLKASKGCSKRESGPETKLSLDDLVAEKRQRLKDDANFEAAMKESLNVATHNLSADNLDIGLKPEQEEYLKKLHRTKVEVSDRHPGENIFNGDRYLSLFSYPETLTLAVCGFVPGSSRTDGRLASLAPDELLVFLEPNFIKLVLKAISCPHAFSSFLFYLLSINHDCFISFQLHRILYNIVHSSDCDWVPSVLMVARVFVNYGADLSDLCPDLSLLTFSSADLPLTGGAVRVDTNDSAVSRSSDANFLIGNLKYVLQIMTDAIAVGPSRYTAQDCLALTLVVLRVSLDRRLTVGEAHLDVELFLAAAFNAIPSDEWTAWTAELCERAPFLTKQHDNMVYLVGLMPLVSRGIYLRRVLSYLFLRELLSSLPSPPSCDIGSLFELKICKSLALLHTLPPVGDDYTRARSFLSLVEFSVGADDIPPNEKSDLKKLISVLQRMIGRIPHLATNSGQIKLKEQMVILHTKWDLMLRSLGSDTIFTSDGSQSIPPIEVVGDDLEANDEDGSDAENNASYINGSVAD